MTPKRAARAEPKRLDAAGLWAWALNMLGRRALSTGELRQRLARRAAPDVDLDDVVAKLKEYGYLDDRRFAEQYAQSRLDNQGFGKQRVVRDLRQRRVAPKLAEDAAASTYSGTDEAQLVREYLERKYRKTNLAAHLAEEKNVASAFRKLRLAGFSAGASIRVLKSYSDRADELDSEETETAEEQ